MLWPIDGGHHSSHRADFIGHKIYSVGQETDSTGQGSDFAGQGKDSAGQGTDFAGQGTHSAGQGTGSEKSLTFFYTHFSMHIFLRTFFSSRRDSELGLRNRREKSIEIFLYTVFSILFSQRGFSRPGIGLRRAGNGLRRTGNGLRRAGNGLYRARNWV